MQPMYRYYCIETLDDLSNIKKNKMKAEIYLIIKLFIINMNPQFFNINIMKPWKEQLNRIDTHKINRN